MRQLQNLVGTAFHRRPRLAVERQPYRCHGICNYLIRKDFQYCSFGGNEQLGNSQEEFAR